MEGQETMTVERRHRRYRKPRIAEALAVIHFSPREPWDPTVFGRFFERVKDRYPEKRVHEEHVVAASLPGGAQGKVQQKFGTLMRFLRPDGSGILQLSESRLVVNVVPKEPDAPYCGWEEFKPEILRRVDDYRVAAAPGAIIRIGLRYVNRFEFPREGFRLRRVFGDSDLLPRALDSASDGFLARVEVPRGDRGRLLFTLGLIEPSPPDTVTVILDFDHVTEGIELALESSELSGLLDRAHDIVEEAFESFMTPELRREMEESL